MNLFYRKAISIGFCAVLVCLAQFAKAATGETDETFAELLAKAFQPNHYLLMRHALAPGTGDPANFQLGDCTTQRNLSQKGRVQAKATGDFLRAHGIGRADVYSSEWCRCMDTATLLGFGPPAPLKSLNSFFQQPDHADASNKALTAFLMERPRPGPALLVTHQVNITKLTGVFPKSGEIVVVGVEETGYVSVLGRIDPQSELQVQL